MKLKKGMAIPLVLIFATIMGVVSIYLLRNTRGGNAQNQTSIDQLQSYYIARAGVEHAMVKVKYLNLELYDAMCMLQGRSTLFDYSQIKDINHPENAISEYNPGPIFLYTQKEAAGLKRSGVNTDMSNFNGGALKADAWINTFKEDLRSDYSNYNKILNLNDVPNQINSLNDKEIKDSKIFENAVYNLTDIKVAAAKVEEKKEKELENKYVIEFTVKSVYISPRNVEFDYNITRTLQVSRDFAR